VDEEAMVDPDAEEPEEEYRSTYLLRRGKDLQPWSYIR
jgi:hypothetical protein